MRRGARWLLGSLAALALFGVAGLWVFDLTTRAAAAPAALQALTSDAQVSVKQGDFLEFSPLQRPIRGGVIVYPGANADFRGYSRILRQVAAAGYLVCVVPMPFEMAILGLNRANSVMREHDTVKTWALLGHSLGGAMAAMFVASHPHAVDGLIIWDSYPPSMSSLASFRKPVWHIHRAQPGGAPPASFTARRGLFPPNSTWVPIRGGIHMYFGDFIGGAYQEDWQPTISREENQRLALAATLAALDDIFF